MPSASVPYPSLSIELAEAAVGAGSTVAGAVVLELLETRTCSSVRVIGVQREIVRATPLHVPGGYLRPVPAAPRPIRSGAARERIWLDQTLAAKHQRLAAGRHAWHFAGGCPTDIAPSYVGVNGIIEHALRAEVHLADGRRLDFWQPLHVWVESSLTAAAPVTSAAHATAARRPWVAPLQLEASLATVRLGLRDTLQLSWAVDNPQLFSPGYLRCTLVGQETTRHGLATDVYQVSVGQRRVPLPRHEHASGTLDWPLPEHVAPSFSSDRIRLDWHLEVAVIAPWRLGPRVQLPLELWDIRKPVEHQPAESKEN